MTTAPSEDLVGDGLVDLAELVGPSDAPDEQGGDRPAPADIPATIFADTFAPPAGPSRRNLRVALVATVAAVLLPVIVAVAATRADGNDLATASTTSASSATTSTRVGVLAPAVPTTTTPSTEPPTTEPPTTEPPTTEPATTVPPITSAPTRVPPPTAPPSTRPITTTTRPATVSVSATAAADLGATPAEAAFLACLRQRESGGNYAIVSANGLYFGAYQFMLGTWNSAAAGAGRQDLVGLRPNTVAPADQDYVALAYYRRVGSSPWGGACS